jgi:RHS repeat-associated protein
MTNNDEYGIPETDSAGQNLNSGRFQYTGQQWIPERRRLVLQGARIFAHRRSVPADRPYTANGLNQFTAVGANSYTYDTKGNLTSDGSNSFGYSSENLLTSASVGHVSTSFTYDPLLRLYQGVAGTITSRLAYDGLDRIAEYNGSDALQRRYVFDGGGQPIVWYEGATVSSTTRRFLSSDERGSIVSVTDSSGALLGINSYDEYGLPGSSNLGAFGYTGQAWLPSVGVWYYKARIYSPTAGRFLQTDPIGYGGGGPNLYNYVLSDPVNLIDPLGLQTAAPPDPPPPDTNCTDGNDQFKCPPIIVQASGGGIVVSGLTGDLLSIFFGIPGSSSGNATQFPGGGIGVVTGALGKIVKKTICAAIPRPASGTVQLSATGSLSRLTGAVSAGYSVVVDSSGSVELFQSDGGYRGFGVGAAFAVTAGGSTAKGVGDLAGTFLTGSITSAEAGGGNVTGFVGRSPDGQVIGGEAGLDFGLEDSGMVGVNNSTPLGGISCH